MTSNPTEWSISVRCPPTAGCGGGFAEEQTVVGNSPSTALYNPHAIRFVWLQTFVNISKFYVYITILRRAIRTVNYRETENPWR